MTLPIATFTVNDGAATPVAQTFSIADRTGLISTFRNTAAALIRGSMKFVHEVRLGKTANAANRCLVSLEYPVEGTDANGQTTVLRSSMFKAEANFAPGSTLAERKAGWILFLNALNNADVKDATTGMVSLG